MEFALSEEQRLLDEMLRGLLLDRLSLDKLRQVAAGNRGFDSALWDGLCEHGLSGLLVPEQFGGTGLGILDAAVAAEALGYAAAPAPFAASAVMAPLAVRHGASEKQQAEWLPRMAAGTMRVAVAFTGSAGTTEKSELQLDGAHVSGRVQGLLDAGAATHFLIFLADGRAVLASAVDATVVVALQRSLDRTRPLATAHFDSTPVAVLDAANDRRAVATRVLDAGRVMLAADTLGAAQSMLDKAVSFASERVQFGRAIGSFQSVKHQCAEMATMLEPCRALVWYAAHAQDAVPAEARVTACHAKAHLAEVGRDVSRIATEVHGGMGFTDLLGLHYWFKRIAFDRQALGGPEQCRHEAAVAQGWIAA